MVFNDLVYNYVADDSLVFGGSGGTQDMIGLRVNRIRDAYSVRDATSKQTVSGAAGGNDKEMIVDGFLIQGVALDTANQAWEANDLVMTIKNGAQVAGNTSVLAKDTNGAQETIVRNYYAAMLEYDTGTALLQQIERVSYSTFRELDEQTQPSTLLQINSVTGNADWDHILFRGGRTHDKWQFGAAQTATANMLFTHVAFVDMTVETAGGNREVVLAAGNAGETFAVTFSYFTIAWTPGTLTLFADGMDSSGDDTIMATLRDRIGFLIVNGECNACTFTGLAGADLDQGVTQACLVNLEVDSDTDPVAPILRDEHFSFVDSYGGNFQQTPESPGYKYCGAENVGVLQGSNWGLKVLHHDAYKHGDTWNRPGGGGSGSRGPRPTP
jgi:hypothetical protein